MFCCPGMDWLLRVTALVTEGDSSGFFQLTKGSSALRPWNSAQQREALTQALLDETWHPGRGFSSWRLLTKR